MDAKAHWEKVYTASDPAANVDADLNSGSIRSGRVSLLQFHSCEDLRPIPGNGFHEQLSSKHSEPLSHTGESDPRLGSRGENWTQCWLRISSSRKKR